MTSSQSDLAARLRQKWETDRKAIEETGAQELRQRGESLSNAARSAQRSIEADMAAWTGRTRALLTRAWLLPAAMGVSLFLGISSSSPGICSHPGSPYVLALGLHHAPVVRALFAPEPCSGRCDRPGVRVVVGREVSHNALPAPTWQDFRDGDLCLPGADRTAGPVGSLGVGVWQGQG